MEQRIKHLLEAARRAEAEGDLRTAGILRRMAKEAEPVPPSPREFAREFPHDFPHRRAS